MGKIIALCLSEKKGTRKRPVDAVTLVAGHGLQGDAHAGNWHRQVSLLALEKINAFQARGALVAYGDFGENLVVEGLDLAGLTLGAHLKSGQVLLEISQIGKECHTRCAIYHSMGECIMPTQGVFARVLHGGTLKAGDALELI